MIESIVLGMVQGLTEFIPVSSTGHLVLIPGLFGWSGLVNSLTFDIALHFGTTTALLGYFWKDWADILRHRRKLIFQILAGTVPVGVVGVLFKDTIAEHLRRMDVIAGMLVLFGGVMLLAERVKTGKDLPAMTFRDALLIGGAQVLALIPGVSRSGVTIAAGMFVGYRRPDAARFSFLLSTPAVLGATVLESRSILQNLGGDMSLFFSGFLSSLLAGLAALGFLMNYLRKKPVTVFVYYRFLLAGGIILTLCLRG
ncbi:MAG: undecaprenyl-diphosphate phosphatase [Thermodesulfobacteriota bacterium]